MKPRLTLLCLSIALLFLASCRTGDIPNPSYLPAGPGPQVPAAQPDSAEEPQIPAVSPDEYYAMVSALNTRIMDESELLIRAGLYEYNWWGSYSGDSGGADLNAMMEQMMDWLSENFDSNADTIAAARNDLIADYMAVAYANVDGAIPPEVTDQVDTLFAAYCQLYAIVTQPSGTVQDFVRMLCSCTYSITTINVDLAFPFGSGQLSFT